MRWLEPFSPWSSARSYRIRPILGRKRVGGCYVKVRTALAAGVSALFLAGSVTGVHAQSLGDVAKKEEARRKELKEPAKTYTNKDLNTAPVTTTSTPAAAAPAVPPTAADAAKDAKAKKDAEDKAKEKDKEPAKDQKYWAGRLKELRTQLDRDQTYADALQTKINSLTTDFVNRDDPAQRAQIARDKQKSMDELNRLKQAIQNDKKAITDLEEEARKAGVPPGWLRS
jgi:DNA repair exonuclease SbcCD ATPase subunit